MPADVFGEIGFLGMLTATSGLQGLFLSALLVFRYNDNIAASRWVALLVLLMSLHLLDMTFSKTQLMRYFATISNSSFFLLFLVGPLYFFHVRALLKPEIRHTWKDLLHAIPACYILYEFLPWIMAPTELKVAAQQRDILDIPTLVYIKLGFNIIQITCYLAYSKKLIHNTLLREADYSADTEISQNIRFLDRFTKAFIIWTMCYLITFIGLAIWGGYGEGIDHVWLFISGLFIQFIGVISLLRPTLFSQRLAAPISEPMTATTSPSPDKYGRSALSEKERKDLRTSFEAYMKNEKPYLDNELRMPTVAEALQTTPHHLSQMLNQEVGESFLRTVNNYRIDEAIRLLADQAAAKTTVLEIAYASGFNNKNSFNRTFKQATGKTPTAYRHQVQKP